MPEFTALIRRHGRTLFIVAILAGLVAAATLPLLGTAWWARWVPLAAALPALPALLVALFLRRGILPRHRATAPEGQPTERAAISGGLMSALNAVHIGVLRFDAQDRLVDWNEAMESFFPQLLGVVTPHTTFREIAETTVRSGHVHAPDGIDAWLARRLRMHEEGGGRFEQHYRDGSWLLVNEYREPSGDRIGIYTDITHVKQAEARLGAAIDALGEGMLIFDRDARLVLHNAQINRLTDQEFTALLEPGRHLCSLARQARRLGWIPPRLLRRAMPLPDRSAPSRWEWQLADGRRVLVGVRVVAGGDILVSVRDVTDQRERELRLTESESRLRHAVDDLGRSQEMMERQSAHLVQLAEDYSAARKKAEEASRAKTDFLAMMSHEIRTPMTGILGMIDLMDGTRLDPLQRDYLATVRRTGDALLTVINDILDLSKLESGRLQVHNEVFNIGHVVGDVVELLSLRAAEKRLRIEVGNAMHIPPWIEGDPGRLRQILLNLLGNAVKFTDAGQVAVRISMDGLPADGEPADTRAGTPIVLRFEIQDSGIGISPDLAGSLFDPFAQADSSAARRYGGTGLGLAICRRLTRMLGGDIGFTSEPGRGSTFWFTVASTVAAEPALMLSEEAAAGPLATGAAHLLVAEDTEVNRYLAKTMLEAAGYRVTTVTNGVEAVEAVRGTRFDAVLMDIHMPEMDGITATRQIRAMPPPAGGVPVIALTANVMSHDRGAILEAGMDDFVAKPIDRAGMLAAVARQTRRTAGSLSAPPQPAGPATGPADAAADAGHDSLGDAAQ